MRSVEEHRRVVAGLITARPPAAVPLADALGLVLAEEVVAGVSLPGFDNSAMDGYAVLSADVATASDAAPVRLPVAEDIPAGRTDIPTLQPGTAHRIMTGAPLPHGATAVVPVEATDGAVDTVTIRARAAEGQHIRHAGEDVTAGTTVLQAGQVLTPAALGLAAALGLRELTVTPRQRVLVVSTGTELLSARAEPRRDRSTSPTGSCWPPRSATPAQRWSRRRPPATTSTRSATTLQRHTLADADLILTTGGVSAGAYEVVKDALGGPSSGVEFVKVAMQPGMPQGAGALDGTPIGHAARQPGQRAGVLRGVRPPGVARGDGH